MVALLCGMALWRAAVMRSDVRECEGSSFVMHEPRFSSLMFTFSEMKRKPVSESMRTYMPLVLQRGRDSNLEKGRHSQSQKEHSPSVP